MAGLRMRAVAWFVVPVVALGLALAACAGPPAAPPGDGSPWDVELVGVDTGDIDCRAELDAAWGLAAPDAEADDDARPAPVRVDEGVEAVAMLRCTQNLAATQPEGIETARMVAVLEHLEGDVAAVIAELAKPDGPDPGPETMCAAMMELVRPLWIVQPDGTAVRVDVPRDTCGFTFPEVWDAVDALEVVDRVEFEGGSSIAPETAPPLVSAGPEDLPPYALDPGQLGEVLCAVEVPPAAAAPTAAPEDPSGGGSDALPCATVEPYPAPPAD